MILAKEWPPTPPEILSQIGGAMASTPTHAKESTPGNSTGLAGKSRVHSLSPQFPVVNEAAFHGLAGEIVRKILPHTEADPAALLFQLLAAFGNVAARNPYTVADGSKHFLNLFGVLVGQSGKGRKGTSWNQIRNLMDQADELWLKTRVIGGLSTGEGLIWNVRDPIEKQVPVKDGRRHTGEYETVIEDPGESDKRLFLIEGEFAQCLKVMQREGNTLSAIIRAAWDSGNLATLTKNSPARATDAHISIIGHITRDELRKLLNETEAANGFANRFCWIAVKRSKCLPEGGAIHTEDFSDIIKRLKSAIDFARKTTEVKRSEPARQLWRECYPTLSEGKPGLFGSVTGRSEAQVMRLSAVYALLDESNLIHPVHHQAAMALWEYCEQSARWIFGDGTGNAKADKILEALRQAGGAGMTRTEISERVFARNIKAEELGEALQTLENPGLAHSTKESTGGAPRERWFAT